MQQLTLDTKRSIAWREVSDPTLEGDCEALVRPLAVTRCDIDFPYASGLLPAPRAFALGHECIGEIVALGDAVKSLRLGQRVIVPFQISCGTCGRCRRGHTGTCESVPFLSAYGMPLSDREWGGALSDLVRVPFAEAMLVAAPAHVPPWTLAAAADNATDGWRCVAPHLRDRPNASVLVLAGVAPGIALYAADAALALGTGAVHVASQNREVLDIAAGLGAKVLEGPFTALRGTYELTVECTGDPAGLVSALRSTDREGVCVSPVYHLGETTPVPMGRMYSKGISFHVGRCHARAALPEVAEAIAAGQLHPDRIVTRRVGWHEAVFAMGEPAVKLVVDREASQGLEAPNPHASDRL